MPSPKIAGKEPKDMELEPGQYWWCSCGESKNQPFCDGSHKVTEFKPVPFDLLGAKKVWLCNCKHTKNRPYCDGTHKNI